MWFQKWFNEDYLRLYAYHNQEEAEAQVNFLVSSLNLKGSERVLDLGCGAGRHSLAFAKLAFRVVGIDLSPTMISKAQESLRRLGQLPATFLNLDMFTFADKERFDLAVSFFNSFGYFEEDDKNAQVFATASRNLAQGGKFFLDYLHPDKVIRDLKPYEEILVDHEIVRIHKKLEGRFVIKKIQFPHHEYLEKVKLYTYDEIVRMLSKNGFEVLKVWGDFKGNPWQKNGDRQMFSCIKSDL